MAYGMDGTLSGFLCGWFPTDLELCGLVWTDLGAESAVWLLSP